MADIDTLVQVIEPEELPETVITCERSMFFDVEGSIWFTDGAFAIRSECADLSGVIFSDLTVKKVGPNNSFYKTVQKGLVVSDSFRQIWKAISINSVSYWLSIPREQEKVFCFPIHRRFDELLKECDLLVYAEFPLDVTQPAYLYSGHTLVGLVMGVRQERFNASGFLQALSLVANAYGEEATL